MSTRSMTTRSTLTRAAAAADKTTTPRRTAAVSTPHPTWAMQLLTSKLSTTADRATRILDRLGNSNAPSSSDSLSTSLDTLLRFMPPLETRRLLERCPSVLTRFSASELSSRLDALQTIAESDVPSLPRATLASTKWYRGLVSQPQVLLVEPDKHREAKKWAESKGLSMTSMFRKGPNFAISSSDTLDARYDYLVSTFGADQTPRMCELYPLLLALRESTIEAKLGAWQEHMGLGREEVVAMFTANPSLASQSPRRVSAWANAMRQVLQQYAPHLLAQGQFSLFILRNYSITRCPPDRLLPRGTFVRDVIGVTGWPEKYSSIISHTTRHLYVMMRFHKEWMPMFSVASVVALSRPQLKAFLVQRGVSNKDDVDGWFAERYDEYGVEFDASKLPDQFGL